VQVFNVTSMVPEPYATGLRVGELVRTGGVVRIAKGFEGAGQIAVHLRDTFPQGALQLLAPSTGPLLQLSSVAAAAGVLNLGVSAVGFAVVCHKLGVLQRSVNAISTQLDQAMTHLDERLDRIDLGLVELRYLAVAQGVQLREVVDHLREIRRDLLMDKLAALQATATRLQTDPEHVYEAVHAIRAVRLWLESTLDGSSPSADRPNEWGDWFVRYRIWCMAVVLEVSALRAAGDLAGAATAAAHSATRARVRAADWAAAIAPPDEFGGVGRFGFAELASRIPEECRHRLLRMDDGLPLDRAEILEREREGAARVIASRPSLDGAWIERHVRAAHLLDFVEETTERLESLRDEMDLCQRRRLTFDRWERIGTGDEHALLMIEVGR
jgi:hypothetical protein